ncbi:thioredoxin-related transmembrane protein 1-like [Xenia sp. Carnegie-2017]|uniref:thioredoxin-related transmembrane protein 1-like n=1 Tax=Xenia sp. Carnegie-2017 TaxID=2897299 RepID=UPI001F0377F9|nr:thioredoxin-related transmembrane protein 1-like [Xenia sp. Carnegie-2017]
MEVTDRNLLPSKVVASCLVYILFIFNTISVQGESEILTEENWDVVLNGQWMIKFYAPWCPACRNLRPTWEKFAVKAESLGVRVAEIDVTKNPGLSGRFGVVSLPTIYHAIQGKFRVYKEKRKLDELVDFVTLKKWETVEPVPSWKSPGSILMGSFGMVFRASIVFRDIHIALTEGYGLPAWASFVIFGVVTIIIGLLFGMILVFISDYLFGGISRPPSQPVKEISDSKVKDEASDDDMKSTSPDDDKENANDESGNIRKRPKKLKATMD